MTRSGTSGHGEPGVIDRIIRKKPLEKPLLYPAELRDRIDIQGLYFEAKTFGSFLAPYPPASTMLVFASAMNITAIRRDPQSWQRGGVYAAWEEVFHSLFFNELGVFWHSFGTAALCGTIGRHVSLILSPLERRHVSVESDLLTASDTGARGWQVSFVPQAEVATGSISDRYIITPVAEGLIGSGLHQ